MTKQAFLYARVSYGKRHTGGRNLAGQPEMAWKYATGRHIIVRFWSHVKVIRLEGLA
jgi:hypothetical protein